MNPGDATVLVRRAGRTGRITLNRPRALNALNLEMIRTIAAALESWRADPAIHAVVLDAAGDRAFCAGGDVRHLRQLSIEGRHTDVEQFFTEEYALNLAIARYPKPYVSLIGGICMGGGIGLSAHGSIRVATDTAAFAMPETAIGLFPDVGATFILPRLRGAHGMHLALTGERVDGATATWLGLATHYAPGADLAALADALATDGIAALPAVTQPPPAPPPQPGIAAFAEPTLPAVLAALEAQDGDWSRAQRETLGRVSPSALFWTFAIVSQGAHRTLEQCQAAELALTRHTVPHADFHEGVRAMLVDKDHAPKWSPPHIADVNEATIHAMLAT